MKKAISFQESQMSKRTILADQVPLEKPFAIQFGASAICNLKCEFCTRENPELKEFFLDSSTNGMMDYQLFRRIIDDIRDSFGRVKQIILSGVGEPLMNPHISDMVAYISQQQVADRIELITNGVLLTPEMSDRLIKAGLTHLRVSIYGLSDEDYLQHSRAKVDFQRLVDQIKYFHAHKEQPTVVYVKIMSYMVAGPGQREKFYDTFERICDVINIENLSAYDTGIDYQKIAGDDSFLNKRRMDDCQVRTPICSTPFYLLEIRMDGTVVPCSEAYVRKDANILGDLRVMSLRDVWQKHAFAFQRRMLDGAKNVPGCENCPSMLSAICPEDVLDEAAERLKVLYDAKMKCGE